MHTYSLIPNTWVIWWCSIRTIFNLCCVHTYNIIVTFFAKSWGMRSLFLSSPSLTTSLIWFRGFDRVLPIPLVCIQLKKPFPAPKTAAWTGPRKVMPWPGEGGTDEPQMDWRFGDGFWEVNHFFLPISGAERHLNARNWSTWNPPTVTILSRSPKGWRDSTQGWWMPIFWVLEGWVLSEPLQLSEHREGKLSSSTSLSSRQGFSTRGKGKGIPRDTRTSHSNYLMGRTMIHQRVLGPSLRPSCSCSIRSPGDGWKAVARTKLREYWTSACHGQNFDFYREKERSHPPSSREL